MALTKAHTRMIEGDALSVLDYGAVGDGTTDDTTAFQACADALVTNGGIMSVPVGTYKLTATVNIPGSVVVEGEGNNSLLKFYDAANFHGLSFYGGDWTPSISPFEEGGVRDLRIDGSNLTFNLNARGAVRFYIVGHAVCENVRVENWQGVGFMLDSSTDVVIRNCYVYRSYEHSVYISGHYATAGYELTGEGGHKILNNTIVESGYNSGTTHMAIKQANDARNVSIKNNLIIDSTSVAINAETTVGGTITGNAIKGSAQQAIRLLSTAVGPISISDNTITDGVVGPIKIEGGADFLISNNYIKPATSTWAMVCDDMNDSVITGNIIDGAATNVYGIDIDGTSSGNLVSGNTFTNSLTIDLRTVSTTSNNTVINNLGDSISNGGTRNVFRTKRVGEGTVAPTAGVWAVGDITYNSAPAAGGTMGWVCTTAGTPGTWKTFGTISA